MIPLPAGVRSALAYVGAAIALILLLATLKGCYDRSVIKAHETGVKAEVGAKTAAANADAAGTVSETRNDVQKGNADAREAANAGTDPLGDGLRSLRAEAGSDRPATR